IEVVGEVASALDAAFNAPRPGGGEPVRIVHRDVKPSNIRLGRDGQIKLLDFGIARTDELTREARTGTDVMMGSPPYMAPERFLDSEPRSASDVFALGVTLWEGIAGERMFAMPVTVQATHAVDPKRYHLFTADRLAEIEAKVPPEVHELLRAMVSFDPADRPLTAELGLRCDALLDLVEGPSLARWARHRSWPPPKRIRGALEGLTLEEGSPDHSIVDTELRRSGRSIDPAVSLLTPSTGSRLTSAGLVLGGISATLLAGLGFVATLVIGGLVWFVLRGLDPALIQPVPAEAAPRPEPAAGPGPGADRPLQGVPLRGVPLQGVPLQGVPLQGVPLRDVPWQSAPGPGAPLLPEEQPTDPGPRRPPPDPAPQRPGTGTGTGTGTGSAGTARIEVSGPGAPPVVLVSGSSRIGLPADVPAGVWRIHVQWPDASGFIADRRITISAGQDYLVRCSVRMRTCSSDATP
ncbi:MAG TPA: hypothetical protein ENK18_00735, partial [Deltaproteobacteria bacterium]|nr:hypothetical protein [Deltaproteobacteria bacterium]